MIPQIVITTEKPSVAREYAKTLHVSAKGDGFIEGYSDVMNSWVKITWCVGHLCTLSYPEAYNEDLKQWKLETLPFLPEEYKYEVISSVEKQFKVFKKALNDIGTPAENKRIEKEWPDGNKSNNARYTILYAGDSGREGLYIQMLCRQMANISKNVKENNVDERIVWIDSFTESEILKGISTAKPVSAYDNQTSAAYMRAIEDYMLGINFSRALTIKYGSAYKAKAGIDKGSIAVGRVMTCVLAMIVEREREILNFKETPFFKIAGTSDNGITVNWKAVESSKFFNSPLLYDDYGFKEKKDADALCTSLNGNKIVTVNECKVSEEKKSAPLLFNLAEIQNFCSEKYKISPDQTLKYVQSLYEKKLTTYPRTDARVISTAVAREIGKTLGGLMKVGYKTEALNLISQNKWHKDFDKNKRYVDDSKITDHYAIIPTGYSGGVDSLDEMETKIFHDIIERFLCIFFPPAKYTKIEAELLHSSGEKLFANAKSLKEPGYLQVLDTKEAEEKTNAALVDVKKGDQLSLTFELKEGKTNPPKRYTSGSMVIAMENAGKLIEDEELRAQIKGAGIGTSATRAAIIEKLIKIGFIKLNTKTQVLTPLVPGECVYDIVKDTIPELLKPEMTASWERGLSKIETGEVSSDTYKKKLEEYVTTVVNRIKEKADSGMGSYSGTSKNSIAGLTCPLCKKGSIIENSKAYGCSEYKNGCKFVIWKVMSEKNITASHVRDLITKGKTGVIKGFVSKKTGKKFDAPLKLVDGKAEFDFKPKS